MRHSLDRLWLFIAVAVPALVALLVPMPAVDLAYQVRAGDEILAARALPVADTWTFTVWGTAVGGPAVAGTGEAGRGVRHRRLGAAGGAAGGTGRLHDGCPGRGCTRAWGELTDGRDPRAGGVRPGRPGARAPTAAVRDRPVCRPAVADRGAGAGRPGCTCWRPWSSCCGRTSTAASYSVPRSWDTRGSATSLRSGPHVSRCGSSSRARPRRSSIRTVAGAWAYAVGIGANPAIAGQVSEWQRTSPFAMPGLLFYPSVIVTVALMSAVGTWSGGRTGCWSPHWR